MISNLSPESARLSRIDEALFESLADAGSDAFAVIPKLLGKRFEHLFDAHLPEIPENPGVRDFNQWMTSGGWISGFCMDMRELLLAELEVRIQPVTGLIDALTNINSSRTEN